MDKMPHFLSLLKNSTNSLGTENPSEKFDARMSVKGGKV